MKSNRVPASRLAWSTALRTSCMSTSETTSNVGMRDTIVSGRAPAVGGVGGAGPRPVGRDRGIVSPRGSVPEWPKGADCKSAGTAYEGSNPSRPTHPHGRPTARRGARAGSARLGAALAEAVPFITMPLRMCRDAILAAWRTGSRRQQVRRSRSGPARATTGRGPSDGRRGRRTPRRCAASILRRIPVVGRALDRLTVWDEAVRSRWPFSALGRTRPRARHGRRRRLAPARAPRHPRVHRRHAPSRSASVPAAVAVRPEAARRLVLRRPAAAASRPPSAPAGLFLGLVAVYGGLVLFMRVWYGLIRTLSQVPGVPVRKLVAVFALWIVPLLLVRPAVQPRRLQLRGPGRDDEPPHQPVPLRPRRSRGGARR